MVETIWLYTFHPNYRNDSTIRSCFGTIRKIYKSSIVNQVTHLFKFLESHSHHYIKLMNQLSLILIFFFCWLHAIGHIFLLWNKKWSLVMFHKFILINRTINNGYRYFVSFIDDASWFTWLYLSISRDELPSIFHVFHKMGTKLVSYKYWCN